MAALKKGSKGKPVEALQLLINKNGAKPPLNVDGVFGPLTEKALRVAQKKLKLDKADGVADPRTLAALKYGKPLPRMETPDVSKKLLAYEDVLRQMARIEQELKAFNAAAKLVEKEIISLRTNITVAVGSDVPGISRMVEATRKTHMARQKFDKLLLANPAAAAKLAQEAASSHKYTETLAQDFAKSVAAAVSVIGNGRKTLSSGFKTLESSAAEIEKAYVAAGKKSL